VAFLIARTTKPNLEKETQVQAETKAKQEADLEKMLS